MDKMLVEGGHRLKGEVTISGAKNAVLPLMCASILTEEPCTLEGVPRLQDILTLQGILEAVGVKITFEGETLSLHSKVLTKDEAPYDMVRKMRASVLILGPLLARLGHARVSLPGGCAIGVRPVDLHLKALKALGAKIDLEEGYVQAEVKRLQGASILFDTVTVTGTIHAMMAASLAKGLTRLENCAREPEVTSVAEALQEMGAKIQGAGSAEIEIEGVERLKGFHLRVIPDRIETGTYAVAAALTEGELFLRGAKEEHLRSVFQKFEECGMEYETGENGVLVRGKRPILPQEIRTSPYPGFPTDMQAQFMVLLSLAEGSSTITETIFENRFMHAAELIRMGANLAISGNRVTVRGVSELHAAPVMATDLRASASLVLAGLAAKGTTEIRRIYHLDRGYAAMEEKLKKVGAVLWREAQ